MRYKVTDYIAEFLYTQGIDAVFEVIGGMITHLIDSIHVQGKIRLISVHHEQSAAFAAEGYARMNGIPGVALATSGPGATNLLTGIGSCYFDSVPAIFITGQVNRHELKGNRPIRQLGFQETDIVSMAAPITKKVWQVSKAEDIPAIFAEATKIALSGRPGPVLIDVPMDVQNTIIDCPPPEKVRLTSKGVTEAELDNLLQAFYKAEHPLILVGGGLRSAGAGVVDDFRAVVNKLNAPVINSLMGVDVLPSSKLRIGLLGSYGNRWVNMAIGMADFILVLGSRLDIRQTGADTNFFSQNRVIYHVDVDEGEVNNRVTGCETIIAHLGPFLSALNNRVQETTHKWNAWVNTLEELKAEWPDTDELGQVEGINPNKLMHHLARYSSQASAYSVDVGQHQMWAAQSIDIALQQRFLTSGGMGAMGFSLPAALGASFAVSPKPVVLVAGDGSFQLNIQELQTVAHHKLPIKMVVLNNQNHGMVRQFQQSYFDERYAATYWGYSAPDFARVAQAYGIEALSVTEETELDAAFEAMWADPNAPFLLQVAINPLLNVYPKIAFGHPITEMEPFVKPKGMEST